jgi:guanylate kinase
MSLSQSVAERLDRARLLESDYRPNEDVCREIGETILAMVVAPPATGKTTVMERAASLDDDFGLVSVFSTRDARPDDKPGMFRIFPHTDEIVTHLLDKIERQEVVNYAIHPTQDTIYGTEAEDYPRRYNLLATLSNGVEQLRNIPFEKTHVIGLATEPDNYAAWFNRRYPEQNKNRARRLGEAGISLGWLLSEENEGLVTWVENIEGRADIAAKSIIDIVKHGKQSDEWAIGHARAIQAWVQNAIEREAE